MTQHAPLTDQQHRDRALQQEALTAQLADDVRNLFMRLFQRAYTGQHSILHGLSNCMEWMRMVLDANGVDYQHEAARAKGARGGSVRFRMHGFAFEMYNFDVHGDTRNHVEDVDKRGEAREYLGNMVVLRIYRQARGFHKQSPSLRMQWLAADIMTSDYGMTREEFDNWGWAFPKPLFCGFTGEHKDMRDWLMLAKQSLSN